MRTASEKDYYAILGINADAGDEQIKKAYRRLAFEWHPDRNPERAEAAERFKDISESYAVLIDPAKRKQYDYARRVGRPGEFGFTQQDIFRDLFTNPAASSIFEELAREFERMGMRVDRHYFQQTLFGGRTVVSGGVFIISPLTPLIGAFRLARAALRGAAHTTGKSVQPAYSAQGGLMAGAARRIAHWLLGRAETPKPTKELHPDALTMPLLLTEDEARQGGPKRVRINSLSGPEDVLVTIPAGIRNGVKLRLRGKGHAQPDGSRGDLYLAVEVTRSAV